VADPEVRVDVAPTRRGRLELLPKLPDEDVDRAIAVRHRVAPHALIDLLALEHLPVRLGEQLDQLELAPGQVEVLPADEGLELIGADLQLAGHHRPAVGAGARTLAATDDSLHARDYLLGVAGLVDPVVGAQPQPAHALGDGGALRADDQTEPRDPLADGLDVLPGPRTEQRHVDDERVEPHGDELVRRDGCIEAAELPAHRLHALGEHADEAGVRVDRREPYRSSWLGHGAVMGPEIGALQAPPLAGQSTEADR